MTTPKYPPKRKRKDYWKAYDRARIKDFRKVRDFCLEIVRQIGLPYQAKKLGRRPNLKLEDCAALSIMLAYFDLSLRDMEGEIPLLFEGSLDHSNVSRWFEKLDDGWVEEAVKLLHGKIQGMFRKGEAIIDSTKITTTQYNETSQVGETILELLTVKLHLLVVYFWTVGVISIASIYTSHGDLHDSQAVPELLGKAKLRVRTRIHGDKAYNSEEIYEGIFDKKLQPNIVPKDRTKKGFWTKKAKSQYDNEARKKFRGLIEGVFGGMTTENGTRTRFVKDRNRKTHLALMALSHEIRTYFRAVAIKAIALIYYFRNNPQKALEKARIVRQNEIVLCQIAMKQRRLN